MGDVTQAAREQTPDASPFASLIPEPGRLASMADAIVARQRRELTALAEQGELPEAVRVQLDNAVAALPEATGSQDDAAIALLEVLWARVSGRNTVEHAGSLLISSGIAMDALVEYARMVDSQITQAEEFNASLTELSEALSTLTGDSAVSARLAVWARRIAGDTVVWTREILGIEPGSSADTLAAGAEAGAERLASQLFSNHSRRMNTLNLAA